MSFSSSVRSDQDGQTVGKCRRRCHCLDGIHSRRPRCNWRASCCGWRNSSKRDSNSEVSSVDRIADLIPNDPGVKEFEFERFIVSKAMTLLIPHYVEDEKYPADVPFAVDSEGGLVKHAIKDPYVELSYSGLAGHRCSYVQKTPNGKIILLRKPLSMDDNLAILADVNTVIQNHINKIIASETWQHRIKRRIHVALNSPAIQEVKPEEDDDDNDDEEENEDGGDDNHDDGGSGNEIINIRVEPNNSLSSDLNRNDYNQSSQQDDRHVLTKEEISNLSMMDTFDMLDKLPSLSEIIREELNIDNEFIHNHAEMLEHLHILHEELRTKPPKMDDRWFALVYTDNGIKGANDNLYIFQYLVIRLILLTYCVAFEERDVSHANTLREFVDRFQHKEVEARLPFVFSKGTSVGSVDVMYRLHNQRLISTIFKRIMEAISYRLLRFTSQKLGGDNSIKIFVALGSFRPELYWAYLCFNSIQMSPEQYNEWRLRDPPDDEDSLSLQVSSWAFPRIHEFLAETPRGRKKSLKSETFNQFHTCIFLIKQSQEYWDLQLKRKYLDPSLRIYVLLKGTVRRALNTLENILERNSASSESFQYDDKSSGRQSSDSDSDSDSEDAKRRNNGSFS